MNWNKISQAEEPKMESIVATFSQDGNTNGSTSDIEVLEVRMEGVLSDVKDDHYFVIKTEGWSFDSVEEIAYLCEQLKKVIQ
jgi:hypothetical protein